MRLRVQGSLRAPGMTLMELLTVISIIAILAALLIPAIGVVRDRGQMAYCQNNLRNIGQALAMYTDEHDDRFPAVSREGNTVTWDADLLAYVGGSADVFLCPSDRGRLPGVSNPPRTYSANGGVSYGPQPYPFGNYSLTNALRTSDLDFNKGDIILIGERPCDRRPDGTYDPAISGSRGYVGQFPFCGLDSLGGSVHRKGDGSFYLMGSFAVQYYSTNQLAQTNLWTLHTQ